ncbi:MAG: ABC transporter ATP-binding protein [Spirochaetaceae bacterium]|nr:MAG: ABC transporter ATP-binding protein [Spirochaetaceae bacterium]
MRRNPRRPRRSARAHAVERTGASAERRARSGRGSRGAGGGHCTPPGGPWGWGVNETVAALLEIRNLQVGYPRGPVVLRVDRETLDHGEIVSLVGPNGGGKTTLLRTAAGLLTPRAGTVSMMGAAIYGRGALPRGERARRTAVVLTDAVHAAYLTGRDVVELGRIARPGPQAEHRAAVERALVFAGAHQYSERRLGSLSDGERQRVMLARALAQEPRMLLLDEPAAHLDPPHQTALFQLLRCLIDDGVIAAAAVATHHLHLALHFSDRLFVVNGTVLAGAPDDLVQSGALADAFGATDGVRLDPERGWFVPESQLRP